MIHKHTTTLTTVAGAASGNTLGLVGGICRQVLIKPATTTTTFKVNITNDDSKVVKSWDYYLTEVNDTTPFPVAGIYTVSITDASANEAFYVLLMVQE